MLVFGEVANYGFDDTTITGEAKYSVNITKSGKKKLFESTLQCK